jgi:hypothetical protein
MNDMENVHYARGPCYIYPFVLLHFALAPVANLHPFLIDLFHFWFNPLGLAAHWTLLGDHRYHGKE